MEVNTLSIIFSDRFIDHVQSPGHPESPQRLTAIRDALEANDLWKDVRAPRNATDDELKAIHDKEYLHFLSISGESMMTLDTVLHKETFEIARLAAGGGIIAAEGVWAEKKPSIALLRPPGHHAGPDSGIGFCYLNNIAVAAENMIERAKKIAIVDIDVHHGNGTQDAFFIRPDILYISTHQQYIFPGTGQSDEVGNGEGEGFTVNIPMNSGAGDSSFRYAHEQVIIPILEEYRPSMLMVSIGGDAHYRDSLASLSLSSSGYVWEIEQLIEFARRRCSGRVAFFLEGGYDLPALAEIISSTVSMFENRKLPLKFTDNLDENCREKDSIDRVKKFQSKYWKI